MIGEPTSGNALTVQSEGLRDLVLLRQGHILGLKVILRIFFSRFFMKFLTTDFLPFSSLMIITPSLLTLYSVATSLLVLLFFLALRTL